MYVTHFLVVMTNSGALLETGFLTFKYIREPQIYIYITEQESYQQYNWSFIPLMVFPKILVGTLFIITTLFTQYSEYLILYHVAHGRYVRDVVVI